MPINLEEKSITPTPKEELRFIVQAAFAPFSIINRMALEHKTLGTALLQTIDRNEYLKDLRNKNSENLRPKITI